MKKTILVVDDEEIIRQFFLHIFSKRYHVLTAANGKEAIETAKKEKPHLVLVDFKMREMDGIETLKHIKSIDVRIPVILFSGYATLKEKNLAKRLGAETFLLKPFDLKELTLIVQTTLEKKRDIFNHRP